MPHPEPNGSDTGALSALAGGSFGSIREASEAVLRLVTEQIGMRSGFVASIEPDGRVAVLVAHNLPGGCAIPEGDVPALRDLVRSAVDRPAEASPRCVQDTRADPVLPSSSAPAAFEIGSYLGVPITLGDGTVFGVLCALDPEPRTLTSRQSDLTVVLARLLATQIERDRELAERERAEEAVRRSEEGFRSLIENASDIITILELDGTIRFESPSVERVLGSTPDELLGQNAFRLVHPDDLPRVQESFGALIAGQTRRSSVEFRFRHKDGTWRSLEAVGKLRVERDGRMSVVVNSRDGSERARAEQERAGLLEEIERERATLAEVMAGMSDGVVVLDSAARIRYCNARAGALVGVDPHLLTGRSHQVAFTLFRQVFADPDDVRTDWEQALTRLEERPTFEARVTGPPSRDVLLQFFPVADVAGGGIGAGVLLRDVTAERDLARAKDELVAVVSHELRTPMTSLIGFAQLLLRNDYDDARRREYLSVIVREGRRLTALVDDFLDVQRLKSGHHRLSPVSTSLGPLVERVVATVGHDQDRPIVVALPPDAPAVRADPDGIQQVLTNLLSNARKYSPAGGEVRLAGRVVDGAFELSVSDHGLGIPPEALPRVFEEFYRVDGPERRAIPGTGLGLAICRRIVEAHGGRIQAASDGQGQGARFAFTVPLDADH